MNSFPDRRKILAVLFTSRLASLAFLLVAILCRVINVLLVTELNRDKIYLALQSKNLLAGNGLTVSKYFSASLETPIYDPTPMWPPGYPILLSPFLQVFNYDVYWATTALDLMACVAIIFIVRKIAVALKFPSAAINIITLVAGCFDYAFIYQSLPTDASSFAIFLLGILVFIKSIDKVGFSYTSILSVALLFFIPCTFRYSYPPLSLAAFVSLIFAGVYLKNKMWVKKGSWGLAFLSFLLIAFFALLKIQTGRTGYIVETERGLFPSNLLEWAPVVPGAFINTFFTTSQLIRFFGWSVERAINLLEIINAIMLLSLAVFMFYLFFKKKFFISAESFRWFLFSGFMISAATCASLGFLSLTYKPQPGWGNYLGEQRYYAFVTLYIQMGFIGWAFLYTSWKNFLFQKLIVGILFFFLFVEITHNIYYNTKAAFNFTAYKTASYKERDYVYFSKMMHSLLREKNGSDIIVIAESDEFYSLMASYLGVKGLYDGKRFIQSIDSIKKKTIIIFALYDQEMEGYLQFISTQNGKLIDKINDVNFYRVELAPGVLKNSSN